MFSPSVDLRIDWFHILVELNTHGYTMYSVAHFTEIPKSTLIGYKQGAQPSYHNGVRLLEFWAQASGKELAEAPRVNPYSFKA